MCAHARKGSIRLKELKDGVADYLTEVGEKFSPNAGIREIFFAKTAKSSLLANNKRKPPTYWGEVGGKPGFRP